MKRILIYLISVGFKDNGFTYKNRIDTKRIKDKCEDWVSIEKTSKGYLCDCKIWLSDSMGKHMNTIPVNTYGEVIAFLKRYLS